MCPCKDNIDHVPGCRYSRDLFEVIDDLFGLMVGILGKFRYDIMKYIHMERIKI